MLFRNTLSDKQTIYWFSLYGYIFSMTLRVCYRFFLLLKCLESIIHAIPHSTFNRSYLKTVKFNHRSFFKIFKIFLIFQEKQKM
ncbi:hypothetical protein HanRHA438_Chr16g0735421 [Helianthus annuus]|nr:hypothetical protein HanRHA438_Chr16g0735421 [Helianthus annuus]